MIALPAAAAAELHAARARDRAAGVPSCCVCGCTTNAACWPWGCGWATLDPPTCTNCR
jgi:hypothetical protein